MKKKSMLIYHEFRRIWGFMIAGIIAVLFIAYQVKGTLENSVINREGAGVNYVLMNMTSRFYIALIAGIMFLVFTQFSFTGSGKTKEFLNFLPVKKTTSFIIKIVSALGIITFDFLLLLVSMLGIYRKYYISMIKEMAANPHFEDAFFNNQVSVLVIQVLMLYLFSIALYSLFVLMEVLVQRNVLSIVIGELIAITPLYLFLIWHTILLRNDVLMSDSMYLEIKGYVSLLVGGTIFEEGTRWTMCNGHEINTFGVYYSEAGIKSLVLLGFTIICLFAAVLIWKKHDEAKENMVIPYMPAKIILFVGIEICYISGMVYLNERVTETIFIVGVLIGIIGSIILWKMLFCEKGKRIKLIRKGGEQ